MKLASFFFEINLVVNVISPREIRQGEEISWYADGETIVRNERNPSLAYAYGMSRCILSFFLYSIDNALFLFRNIRVSFLIAWMLLVHIFLFPYYSTKNCIQLALNL